MATETSPVADIRVLYTAEEVRSKIAGVASSMIETYQAEQPIFVCLLNGAIPFALDLLRSIRQQCDGSRGRLNLDPTFATMTVSRYRHGEEPGEPRIVMDLPPKIQVADRLVVIVDDVLDTGVTMRHTSTHLLSRNALQVDSAVLVQKEGNLDPVYPPATFHAFKSPFGQWLFGMGMDGDPSAPENSDGARWLTEIMIKE